MKTTFKLFIVGLFLIFATNLLSAQDQMITIELLPAKSVQFIKTYFPDKQVSYVMKDYDDMIWKGYDVKFTDGTDIEFDKKGNWKSVDMENNQPVPNGIVMPSIEQFIKTKFPNTFIYKIDKNYWGGYEVEISNGLELHFNSKGKFLRMDD